MAMAAIPAIAMPVMRNLSEKERVLNGNILVVVRGSKKGAGAAVNVAWQFDQVLRMPDLKLRHKTINYNEFLTALLT